MFIVLNQLVNLFISFLLKNYYLLRACSATKINDQNAA